MDLSNFFQILDVWTPSPVEEISILLIGLFIYALPIITIIVIIIVIKKHKKKKQTILTENLNQQNDNINDNGN